MPRLKPGQLPVIRHHKPSGRAVVTLGGKDFYLGRWGSKTAEKEYARVTSEWKRGAVSRDDDRHHNFTLVELLAAFKRHAKEYYGPQAREYATYRTLAKQLAKLFGRKPARKFHALRLKRFRQWLIERGLARRTVNHQVARVKLIFEWAVSERLVPVRVFRELQCVRGLRRGRSGAKEPQPVKPVADAVVDATLPHLAPQIRAMVELQRVSGMRSGEVCIMRTCDITTSGNVWTYTPARHKNTHRGHARTVYLGPRAQEILRPWLRINLEEFLFQPAEADQWRRLQRSAARKTPAGHGNAPGTNRVRKPRRRPGACYTAGSYGKAVTYACEVAFDLPRELRRPAKDETPEQRGERYKLLAAWRAEHCWHPHQLRHRFATEAREQFDLEAARILCGHKHTSATELYAKASERKALELAAKIG